MVQSSRPKRTIKVSPAFWFISSLSSRCFVLSLQPTYPTNPVLRQGVTVFALPPVHHADQGIGRPVFALNPMPLSDSSTLRYIWVRIPVLRQGVTLFAMPPVHHADQGIGRPVFALNPMPLSESSTPHHIYSSMGEDSGAVPGRDVVCNAPCATYRPRCRVPSVCTEPYAAQ
jgi:hypothetical protein